MATTSEKSKRRTSNGEAKNYELVNPYNSAPNHEDEITDLRCVNCLRYWSLNFITNGMFTTSRIVGFSQFMVFMILRVIITGSLCGRLFGHDPVTTNCSFALETGPALKSKRSTVEQAFNQSEVNLTSDDVKMTCLDAEYWNGSPITVWALSLLTVVLPWLILLPWTPLRDDQDYIECKRLSFQWPCLTIYVVRFMKAFLKLVLEFLCLISVPIIYGFGIQRTITCFDRKVICDINDAKEKSYYLWLFMAVNLLSCFLTIWELIDICRNKTFYETERGGYTPSKPSSNRSSTTIVFGPTVKKDQPDVERGRPKLRGTTSAVTKRRMGTNRCTARELHETQKGKFHGRISREADGDAVIKLAVHKDEIKTAPPLIRASRIEEDITDSSSSCNGGPAAVIVHETNDVSHSESDIGKENAEAVL